MVGMELVRKGKTGLADKALQDCWRAWAKTPWRLAVKGRKCFVGWRASEPHLCPRYL